MPHTSVPAAYAVLMLLVCNPSSAHVLLRPIRIDGQKALHTVSKLQLCDTGNALGDGKQEGDEDFDTALAAEIAELDRQESMERALQTREEEEGDEDFDAALAAEIAELDRQEAMEQEMADRQQLARLVMEEIAREAEVRKQSLGG